MNRLLFAVITILFLLSACGQQASKAVFIESRYWQYTQAVEYTDMKCIKLPCSGGNMRRVTETRCSDVRTGDELPPTPPAPSCTVQSGDSITDKIEYFVTYREQESSKNRKAPFSKKLWDKLGPNRWVTIQFSLKGKITGTE